TRRYDDIIWVGHDDDAKLRTLRHLIDERNGIYRILVSRVVLVATQFGEPASHRKEGRCKHDASKISAARQQRGGSVTALAISDEMKACISVTGFDRIERRRDQIDFAQRPTAGVLARGPVGTGSAQVQIRHSETARPSARSVLHRRRSLLD